MASVREIENQVRERIDAFPPSVRPELLHVLMLRDFDRAERIGDYWGSGVRVSWQFADSLMDLVTDGDCRAIVVGMLHERELRGRWD